MNYYQHHIGDFRSGTINMSRLSRWIYRDMLDVYYDTEKPLPLDFDLLCDMLGVESDEELKIVERLLRFKFVKTDDGYRNARCDKEISIYHTKAETAKANGRRGGRPRKADQNPEKPSGFQLGSDPDATGTPGETESKTNQEPITKNQEPKDSSSEAVASDVDGGADDSPLPENPKPEKFTPDDYRLAERMAQAVLRVAPKSKPPDIAKWADTIRLMRERDGLTLGEITEVFRFAHNDSFWKTNILSPTKLREQFARLDAQMRIPTNEKRHTTSADRWAIDHDDTSWLTGTPGSGDCIDGELDFPPNADDLHCLEAGRGGRH